MWHVGHSFMPSSILISAPQFLQVGHSFSIYFHLYITSDSDYKSMGADFSILSPDIPRHITEHGPATENPDGQLAHIPKVLY
jgi:hypothetical protein